MKQEQVQPIETSMEDIIQEQFEDEIKKLKKQNEELVNQLDTLNMQYISQVGLYKSLWKQSEKECKRLYALANLPSQIVSFYEFKECKTEEDYIKKYLGMNLDEDAYQLAYDMSNDWLKDKPNWKDVETAYKVGVKCEQMNKKI